MKIAILGATSQIATDYISSLALHDAEITGFVRNKSIDLAKQRLGDSFDLRTYSDIGSSESFDLVLNCVGVGDPARALKMQESIFKISNAFDDLALELVKKNSASRYVFVSSGVAYGHAFETPATELTSVKNTFDEKSPADQYGLAKYYLEAKHRELSGIPIYDLRVFGYFNHSLSIHTEFLLANIAKSIIKKEPFLTNSETIVRDYNNAEDFFRMINSVYTAPETNIALDFYSLAPVEKFDLLSELSKKFGLTYEVSIGEFFSSPTGAKPNYYSTNFQANKFGYIPLRTSLETILIEMDLLVSISRD